MSDDDIAETVDVTVSEADGGTAIEYRNAERRQTGTNVAGLPCGKVPDSGVDGGERGSPGLPGGDDAELVRGLNRVQPFR